VLIVDAQVHMWGADTKDRPWPPGRAHQAQKPYPVTKELVLAGMKEAGVDRVVVVPPSWEGDRNDLALEAARLYPDRFAVMGRLALEKPESRALVDAWRKESGMLGMRFTFHTDLQRPWLTDGTADWLWPAAERAGVPLMIFPPGSIRAVSVRRAAQAHPPGLRRLRPAADVLGHRLDAADLLVAPGHHALHRGAALALGRGQGVDHGPRHLRLARLAAAEEGLTARAGERGGRARPRS